MYHASEASKYTCEKEMVCMLVLRPQLGLARGGRAG
jgi:hypothetical protein